MPAKNSLKIYVDGGYYHVYNRGVNKMNIFTDKQDYGTFLSYLKNYLTPKNTETLMNIIGDSKVSPMAKDTAARKLRLNNFNGKITLLTYCLMPNHFHFLLKTKAGKDIEVFMKSFMTRYTKYFNKRHKRIGPIFQGRYKAVLVETDEQLLYLTRYIHRNPLDVKRSQQKSTPKIPQSQPSSYPVYLKKIKQEWVEVKFILQNFSKAGYNSYKSFIEDDNNELEERFFATTSSLALDLE